MVEKIHHRSFTVRIPLELYCEIAEEARKEGVSINQKVGQYIRLGMGEEANVNQALEQLIRKNLLPALQKENKTNG